MMNFAANPKLFTVKRIWIGNVKTEQYSKTFNDRYTIIGNQYFYEFEIALHWFYNLVSTDTYKNQDYFLYTLIDENHNVLREVML